MLVAVLSDVHDNIWNLERALSMLDGAGAMLFCGDFCAPFTLQMMADGFAGPIHCVLGNNDGDALLLAQIAAKADHVTIHQGVGQLELGSKRLAMAHYPMIGAALARSGDHQAVFSGHTHRVKIETVGPTLWANPGEVMGRYGEPGFGLYDTDSGELRIIKI